MVHSAVAILNTIIAFVSINYQMRLAYLKRNTKTTVFVLTGMVCCQSQSFIEVENLKNMKKNYKTFYNILQPKQFKFISSYWEGGMRHGVLVRAFSPMNYNF